MAKYGTCRKNDAEVRRLAALGYSFSAIGRAVGTAHRHVSRYMRANGIETRFDQTGANNPAWKGGRQVDKGGYILLYRPDHPQANRHGQVREHRIVMEAMIGRPLTRTEVVHHIDGNPANNSPSNLRLYASNGAHLADDLKGRCPKWSKEGRERILQACRSQKARKRTPTRDQ